MAPKSVFSPKQRSQIVLLFGEHKSVKRVRWEFAKMYGLEHHPRSLLTVKAFKSHLTNHLEPRHKRDRREFCTWLLNKSEDFPTTVIWTDEKMFEERTRPNKQNERYWAVEDPEITDECRVVGG